MINATQLRKGMTIKIEGELYKILETTHVTPGKGQALMQTTTIGFAPKTG